MNTNQLIKRCIKKNNKARETLYNTYKDVLFMTCMKYARSQEEAEDLLHDAFIAIFEKIKTYKGVGSFEGWMKRIAINKSINRYKRRTVFELAINEQADIKEEVLITDDALPTSLDTILSCIQLLPDQYRLVFSLYELDQHTHKEISQMLSISEGTSKSNLHRAKVLLKEKLTSLNQGVSPNN
ncbi:RNA polymerase sigma factor [Spongiivirga sp. MCCC 1A20706]|uniref:RNA polymerase sigma factor n=1 Tax=Spongiivirga sp. MCCC 1A20706 TaxID=3160963 RepID=UPI003977D100